MENITAISVCLSYGLAFAMMFFGYAFSSARRRQGAALPPSLPLGKVAIWLYRPADVLGLVGISGVFFCLVMLGALLGGGDGAEGVEGVVELPKVSAADVGVSIGFQVFVAAVALMITASRVGPIRWLGLGWKKWPLVFAIAPLTVLLMWAFFAGLYAVGWADLLERLGVEQVQDTVLIFQQEKDMVVVVLMAVAAMIVAPVCEEIVFRGYLYPVAKKFAGPWVAGIATALIFSAAHGSVSALLPLFVFGMVLVALYEFTGSIWAPMSVHFLFNSATVLIQMLVRYGYIPDGGG